MTQDTENYNGWANYPTWAVNLWLSNDEGLYRATTELVALEASNWPEDEQRVQVADSLKAWVRDELAPDLPASFASDLLGYALDQVDWIEIAKDWIEAGQPA